MQTCPRISQQILQIYRINKMKEKPSKNLMGSWYRWNKNYFMIPINISWSKTMAIVSPRQDQVVPPSKWPFSWLIYGSDPNHLQVLGWSSKWSVQIPSGYNPPTAPKSNQNCLGPSQSASKRFASPKNGYQGVFRGKNPPKKGGIS